MKHFLVLFAALASTSLFAMNSEFSGNLEAQVRRAKNNDEAKEDLFQTWDEETFSLAYGNLSGKVNFDNNTSLDTNLFARYTTSDLYENDYAATQIFTFPRKLVVRDIFQLQHRRQRTNETTELILNKFAYELASDDHTLTVGRMYVNYGQGEIFNPLNPFNQPTGLTSIQQVAQGNDGAQARFFLNDHHTLDILLLGDKAIEGYDGAIDSTVWIHGEYQATDKLQLDYVLGQDQNRNKAGGQASYRMTEAMIFSQVLYQSELVNDEPSHHLWDLVVGYDEQLTSKWHIRFEGGHQKKNQFADLASFGDRFLPSEYFAALANQYEIHPLVKLGLTLINDVKTGFTYGIAKSTFDLGHDIEAEIFGFTPVGKGSTTDNPAQKLVTTDFGGALRAFF